MTDETLAAGVPHQIRNMLGTFLRASLAILVILSILLGMTSCSYYTVITINRIHNPEIIRLGWSVFICITLAIAVMAESPIEDLVKLAVFTLFFLSQLLTIIFVDTPSNSQYQMFIVAFSAAWGAFFGMLFHPPH